MGAVPGPRNTLGIMDLDGVRMLAVTLAIGSGVWVGGVATVVIVSATSRRTVAPADRVALFRTFGNRFAVFASVVALVMVVPALALAVIAPTPLTASTLLVAIALLVVTAIGILQARRMSALRSAAASGANDPDGTRRNAATAMALRSLIGLVSLALPVLAALIAARR